MNDITRRKFLAQSGKLGVAASLAGRLGAQAHAVQDGSGNVDLYHSIAELERAWKSIPRTYKPHTRWWWPGTAVTKEGIVWELDQMKQQGIGGVELISTTRMYTKGNIRFLSDEFLEMTRFTIAEARSRDMEVGLTFGSGWSFGGFWVPPEQRSKVMTHVAVDASGPKTFDAELPFYKNATKFGLDPFFDPAYISPAKDENQILAVVAGRVHNGALDADSLTVITEHVSGNRLKWQVPPGEWKIMVFRLKYTGQRNAVADRTFQDEWVIDHFNRETVQAYCDYLGGAFYKSFGQEFGRTVDSLFCDSFEILVTQGTIHWSNHALAEFQSYKGYDLTRYLPCIWWDIGALTPKVRYDINDFLAWLGMRCTFDPFVGWCSSHRVGARIQPHYRFTEEIIMGAGAATRPEMEVSTARFAIVPDPRKAIAAGAHLYGRPIVSAEAYTFLHKERYLTTLEEMKVATDSFLRDGVTQFYNHGYMYTPEMLVSPARDMSWANRISHVSLWWKHYHHLASYVSRCCLLMRQGSFAGDVLVYSPQADVWTEKVLFDNERRVMPYGSVGQILVANGYDFDPVNDDVLQNHARSLAGHARVRDLSYRVIVLPNTQSVPLATMEFLRRFVLAGGILIALESLPSSAVGMNSHAASDRRVQQIATELFGIDGKGAAHSGGGRTYLIVDYKLPTYEQTTHTFNPGKQDVAFLPPTDAERALVSILRSHLRPDFELAGAAQSTGLTFLHRRLGNEDIYFVTNISTQPVKTMVSFRVTGKSPQCWDPMTGSTQPVFQFQPDAHGTTLPIHLEPYASRCILFRPQIQAARIVDTNLSEISDVTPAAIHGTVDNGGEIHAIVSRNGVATTARAIAADVPAPLVLLGHWQLSFESPYTKQSPKQLSRLAPWTESADTAHFSGTGTYTLDFDVPAEWLAADLQTWLELGQVGDVAEVKLNGNDAGVLWMRPYRVEVTALLRAGSNRLQVAVTNTPTNYVAALKTLPEVPAELRDHYGVTAPEYADGIAEWEQREKDYKPLPLSGLAGPVRIVARRKVALSLSRSASHMERKPA